MDEFRKRLPFFLLGLTLGVFLVIFYWSKKDTEFNYAPKARFYKNIQSKELVIEKKVSDFLVSNDLKETTISEIIYRGSIDMWNKKKVDNCTEYKVTGIKTLKNLQLILKNCDSVATVSEIEFL
jgi:hypothetical protein